MKPATRYRWITLLLLLLLLANNLRAQEDKDYFFQKLSTSNGLSSNYIQSVFQDSRGYIWIGTANGLNRYDGKNIKVYHHDAANPRSLPREDVRRIVEDKDGTLWIGADFGLMEFNPLTEEFKIYRHEPGNPWDDHIPQPFIDSKNNLWVGTEKGLHLFNRSMKTFECFLPVSPDSIKKNRWAAIITPYAEDKDHNIWCGGNKGIFRFVPGLHEWTYFPFQNPESGWVYGMLIDHQGRLWIVDQTEGLRLFHPENGLFETMPEINKDHGITYFLSGEWKDAAGNYLMAFVAPRHVLFYNPKTKKIRLVDSFLSNQVSKRNIIPSLVYTDHENKLWIGTTGGLFMIDNADQSFHSITPAQGDFPEDNGPKGTVSMLYEEPGLRIITYDFRGLGMYSDDWKLFRFYPHIPPTDTTSFALDVHAIYKDPEGIYWITTSKSLVRFDRKKNLFKAFTPPDNDFEGGRYPKLLREIVPFGPSCLYIRTRNHGIYVFDLKIEQFVQHLFHQEKDRTSLPANELRAIIKYTEDQLIIVSQKSGVFIYHRLNNTYEVFNKNPDVSINEALNSLNLDPLLSGHILWLNSTHGLLKFDLPTKHFELFNSRNGLANDQVLSSEIDQNGYIWVAHNAGISRFDTLSRTFINFREMNGLVFQYFESNMKKLADGNIYVGDYDQLICFNPGQLKGNQQIPPVHINSVQVLNAPYPIRFDSVTRAKSLTLDYKQDLITVDFSVLNFSHPKENRFYYRLDKDSTWHQVNEGLVNLVGLSPGKHVLHVTGSNDSRVMNPTGDALYIRILPPFYQTWWFIAAILTGIMLMLYMIQRFRINRITKEEHLKTEFNKQLAQAETKALRSQMNPHFIFNSLNSINNFVTDQKHEIASDYLLRFSKLIRLILDNSRSESIPLDRELETLQLYVELESIRFENHFKYEVNIAENTSTGSIMIPPMLLQPFIENAIWHGLIQKRTKGTIAVDLRMENENFLHISITDDGIGREKAAEMKSKSATHQSHGLKVTSERIDMMNKLHSTGAQVHIIDLKDEQGNALGTRVELIIPV